MELKNEFSVDTPIEVTWPMLLDVASIAQCVPGGELLEELDERSFKGRVSVKLGPMLLTFEGIAKFVDIEETGRRSCIEARGTDTKGRGAAQAKVKLQLEPNGQSTNVRIQTDLQLSGSVAQIGRASGLIEEVSRHLIRTFAENLNRRIANGPVAMPVATGTVATEIPAPVPISGIKFAVQVFCGLIARLFRKIRGN